MSNFIVSARKYRPDHFTSVVGQQHITQTLKTAIKNNQIAQAFLFCGPRGVGKTSCARILAKTLNCTNRTSDHEACDVCESCISFKAGTSFNVHELDAASNNTVEDIRGLVEQVRYAPQAGKYKIYIIDEVHMLSTSAFNAFLKTLEEPPSYAIFILATTEKHKIIPTILSRCQIFDFHRIQVKDIARHLEHIAREEAINFEPEALHIIAQKADGALRDALSSFDQLSIFTDNHITYQAVIENLNILDYDYYFKVTEKLMAEDIPGVLLLFDDILRNGFNGNDFINGLNSHFRDLLVAKDEQTLHLLETSEQAKLKYAQQSRASSPSFLLSAMVIGNQAELNYRSSKNPRLQVELALMKMCHILSAFKLKSLPPDSNTSGSQQSDSNTSGSQQSGSNIPGSQQSGSSSPGSHQTEPNPSAFVQEDEKKNSQHLKTEAAVDFKKTEENVDKSSHEKTVLSVIAQRIAGNSVKFRLPKSTDLGKVNEETDAKETELIIAEEEDTRDLNEAEIIKIWDAYAHLIDDGLKVNIHNLVAAYPPRLEGGRVIIASVENSIQRDFIESEIPELQRFMKDNLKHRSISFKVEILEKHEKKNKSLFSAYDRFMHLAEKNPYLMEFKNRLDLDLDR